MKIIKNKQDIKQYSSQEEILNRKKMFDLLKKCPIPDEQLLSNIGLFIESKNLARILFMDFLYRKILETQGSIMEFGTRWGQNVALFSALRGIYEPFNRHRKIIAFDTFEGFPSINAKDGMSDLMRKGQLDTTKNYEKFLNDILLTHEASNPLGHLNKFKICKGNAIIELQKYFKNNPETIISMAYFDFDIYEPTKKCLEMIIPRLTKGSVIGFDELNDPDSPGETLALMETMNLNKISLKKYQFASRVSYFVVD